MTGTQISAGVALEACPFCGVPAVRVREEGFFVAHCDSCNAEGPVMNDAARAIAAWNRRAALSTPATTGEGEVREAVLAFMSAYRKRYARLSGGFRSDAPLLEEAKALNAAALAALPPSSGCASPAIDKPGCVSECAGPDRQSWWEAGAEAMKEAAAVRVEMIHTNTRGTVSLDGKIQADLVRATALPPPPSREG